MAAHKPRSFEAKPAAREQSALLIGLTGASGGGKTFSALRLATGIVSVTGGEIFVIDTDNRRALHYADRFKFQHVAFDPPHSSLAYVDAIRFAVMQGAGCIVVDSMSHEHEGVGGMLDYHDAELDRLAGDDFGKRERMKMIAWSAPKAARRKLILEIQRLGVPAIFCFRAKEGVKPVKVGNKTEIVQQGFTPIAGDEFVFEMTLNALLMPASKGVPTWNPAEPGERKMTKLPDQFSSLESISKPIDETLGENFAKWARGGAPRPKPPEIEDKRQETRQEAGGRQGSDMRDDPPPPSGDADSGPDDGFPGDRPSPSEVEELAEAKRAADALRKSDQAGEMTRQLSEPERPEDPPAEDKAKPQEGGFAAFADGVASATDWPMIEEALRALTASADWKAAALDRQQKARVIAYRRLVELNEKGLGYDYLKSAHAFRCYIEAEEDAEALGYNFQTFKTLPPWNALPLAARDNFVAAVDARVAVLRAGSTPPENFA